MLSALTWEETDTLCRVADISLTHSAVPVHVLETNDRSELGMNKIGVLVSIELTTMFGWANDESIPLAVRRLHTHQSSHFFQFVCNGRHSDRPTQSKIHCGSTGVSHPAARSTSKHRCLR